MKNENRVACPDGLTEPQRLAIELLVMGPRKGKLAKKVGVDRSTLWRWPQDPQFCQALAAAREMPFGAAVRLLRLVRIDRRCASPAKIPEKAVSAPAPVQLQPLLQAAEAQDAVVGVANRGAARPPKRHTRDAQPRELSGTSGNCA